MDYSGTPTTAQARRPTGLVRWLAFGLAATVAFATSVAAQRADSLPIGARVRVQFRHPPPASYDGTLVAVDSLSLTLTASNGMPQVAPFDEITRLEQYVGPISGGMGFSRGARTGMWVGIGTTAFLVVYGFMCGEACLVRTPEGAAAVGIPLTGFTTLIGGIIGSQRRELWVPLPNPGCALTQRSGERPGRCK